MQDDRRSDENRARDRDRSPEEEIRVTDRRRIHLGDDDDSNMTPGAETAEPSLKPSYVEELEARTKAAEQQTRDVQTRFEQVRAQLQRETDETRQRLNRAADERARREKIEFINALLPLGDNLQRALIAAEQGSSFESLLEGVRGTLSGFDKALVSAGVEPVVSVGARFDPELHEAVDTTEISPDRDGLVTAEYSRGYRLGDRLLRPARVQVGRANARRAAE